MNVIILFFNTFDKAIIRSKRLEWADDLWRENGICKQFLIGEINGRIPRGCPKQRWIDTLKTDPAKITPGMELGDNENRERRRKIVEAAKAL